MSTWRYLGHESLGTLLILQIHIIIWNDESSPNDVRINFITTMVWSVGSVDLSVAFYLLFWETQLVLSCCSGYHHSPCPRTLNGLIIVALLHHVRLIPNREEKLASGALLTGLAVMGVNLQLVSNVKDWSQFDLAYFSNNIGPLRASTRPYFLLRVEMSKNSSWLSVWRRAMVCASSSKFSRSIWPFSRLLTNWTR